jgi:hypothetical protein
MAALPRGCTLLARRNAFTKSDWDKSGEDVYESFYRDARGEAKSWVIRRQSSVVARSSVICCQSSVVGSTSPLQTATKRPTRRQPVLESAPRKQNRLHRDEQTGAPEGQNAETKLEILRLETRGRAIAPLVTVSHHPFHKPMARSDQPAQGNGRRFASQTFQHFRGARRKRERHARPAGPRIGRKLVRPLKPLLKQAAHIIGMNTALPGIGNTQLYRHRTPRKAAR